MQIFIPTKKINKLICFICWPSFKRTKARSRPDLRNSANTVDPERVCYYKSYLYFWMGRQQNIISMHFHCLRSFLFKVCDHQLFLDTWHWWKEGMTQNQSAVEPLPWHSLIQGLQTSGPTLNSSNFVYRAILSYSGTFPNHASWILRFLHGTPSTYPG